jgi:molybdate transport system substrate-binding protein
MKAMIAAAMGGAMLFATGANAAEIKVFCTAGMKSIILGLQPAFERASGHKLNISFASTGETRSRIQKGESADVVLMAAFVIDDLVKEGKLAAASRTDIARSGVGVAIRAGVPKPAISTPEKFKEALLAAKSIVYTDPASGGASGIHFAKIVGDMGIADAIKAKSKLNVGSYNAEFVATGEADLAIQQIAEILPVKGAELLGPLPGHLQKVTVFVAASSPDAPQPEAAKALIGYLTSPAAAPVIKAKGMDPAG